MSQIQPEVGDIALVQVYGGMGEYYTTEFTWPATINQDIFLPPPKGIGLKVLKVIQIDSKDYEVISFTEKLV